MTDNVKYLRYATMTQLRKGLKENMGSYKGTSGCPGFSALVDEKDVLTSQTLTINSGLAKKIKKPTLNNNHDAYNSVLVYNAICLNPRQACDERIWVYLSHFTLKNYVAQRWPMPETNQAKHIETHYFVVGQRGLLRDNAIARLWWMGYIASRSRHFKNPEEALNILLHQSDVRANLLERNLGMNPNIFDAVVARLKQDYPKVLKNRKAINNTLFQRARFRRLMKSLNRIGGYRMLDALQFGQLTEEIKTIL